MSLAKSSCLSIGGGDETIQHTKTTTTGQEFLDLKAAHDKGVISELGLGQEPSAGQRTPAEIVGNLVLVAILLVAATEAVRQLNFLVLADLINRFMLFAGEVILGLIIFGIGLYLANLASSTVRSSGAAQAGLLALAARISIMVLAGEWP